MPRSVRSRLAARVCAALFTVFTVGAHASVVPLVDFKSIYIPITPFSNMASGYQATNPGFRAVLRSMGGDFIAGGALTMDSVIRGYSDDASSGSAYGRLVLRVDMEEAFPSVSSGVMAGSFKGKLSICMAQDPDSSIRNTECKNLSGNIHPERPFQWLDKQVDFVIENSTIRITKYYGSVGEGGTSQQLSLAVFHPAYGFAAPGKAFKDYQSPLVVDLNHNGKMDLLNVWNEAHPVRFDLNGNGEKVRTGWVSSKDALLFWDNGTGCVQNGTQLFGEYTGAKDGERTYSNGFEALRAVTGVNEGAVVAAQFPRLKLWQDRNQNGRCEKREVVAASKHLRSIATAFTTVENPPLTEDNEVRLLGTYTDTKGQSQLVGDVWFKQRRHELANH